MIVEPDEGGISVHRNTIGVMANAPGYDWQKTNLRNYVAVSNLDTPPVEILGETFSAFGVGTGGSFGLPGGYSSPARFARMRRATDEKPFITPKTTRGTRSLGSTDTSGFWNMGEVGEPAFRVNAITREVSPITSPPRSPVTTSWVSAMTNTGSRVRASVAELTLMGIRLNMIVSARSSARIAIRLLFFK